MLNANCCFSPLVTAVAATAAVAAVSAAATAAAPLVEADGVLPWPEIH